MCPSAKSSPNFAIGSVLTDLCTSATKPESHRTFNSTNLIMGTWKSITILQPSPRNQHNQHTGLPPNVVLDLLIWNLLWIGGHCWGTCSHGSRVGNVFNGHDRQILGPKLLRLTSLVKHCGSSKHPLKQYLYQTRIIGNVPNIHTCYIV